MSNEDCRTRPNGVLGKPRVYINCTLPGQRDHFDTLAQNILDGFDCQVRRHVVSAANPEAGLQLFSLAQMYVIPVTRALVDQASFFTRDYETLCRMHGIPALVVLCDPGLDGLFAEQFDGWRYLDRASDGSFLPALHALLREVLTPAGPGTGDDGVLAGRQCFQLANDLFEQGQMDQAEQYYQSAFQLLTKAGSGKLSLSMPESVIVRSCAERLQRFAAEAGRQDDAAGYGRVVDAYDDMVMDDPRFLQMLKGNCALFIRQGDSMKMQGNPSLARFFYQKCADMCRGSLKEQLRVFHGQALLRLGELDQQAGDAKRARERFEQALPLLEEQAQSGEKDAPLDLIRCSDRLGDLAVDQRRFPDAQNYYRQYAQLLEQQIQRTGSVEYLSAYIGMCTRLGQVSQEMDEPEEAFRQFSHALDFTQRLSVSADADPTAVQFALAGCYEGLGDICARQEDHESARQYFVKTLDCTVKAVQNSASARYNLAHSYDRLAKEELALGQLRSALDHCTAAQKIMDAESGPDHQLLEELCRCLVLQAKVWRASRQMGQAQPLYEKAVQAAEQAVAKHDSHAVRETLAYAYQELADFCWAMDRIPQAREYDEKKRAALKGPAGKQ